MKDRSLDEFLEDDSSDSDEQPDTDDGQRTTGADETAAETTDGTTPPTDVEKSAEGGDAGVEPALSTSAWDPDGGLCADCGATVERRWHQDGGLVCPDCKEW